MNRAPSLILRLLPDAVASHHLTCKNEQQQPNNQPAFPAKKKLDFTTPLDTRPPLHFSDWSHVTQHPPAHFLPRLSFLKKTGSFFFLFKLSVPPTGQCGWDFPTVYSHLTGSSHALTAVTCCCSVLFCSFFSPLSTMLPCPMSLLHIFVV